ncbi:MAG: hypothetical protein Q4D16_13190 [Eubacteriales bacterium]|nr:hypothetical protein [Eubacteriales bacterium]
MVERRGEGKPVRGHRLRRTNLSFQLSLGDGKGVRQLAAFADANAAQTGLTPCQGTAFPDRSN